MKRRLALIAATIITAATLWAGVASADATAPTQGGNGAGSSGQCTGQPDGRPAVCPATP